MTVCFKGKGLLIGNYQRRNHRNDWSGSRARRNIASAVGRDLLGGRLGKIGRAVSGYGHMLGTMLEQSISRGFSYTYDWLAEREEKEVKEKDQSQ